MSATSDRVTLTLPRTLVEHPRAFHLRRMRAAVWLYLALLARLPPGSHTVVIDPAGLGRSMGVPEATVRSWLGHLRARRYVRIMRRSGKLHVRIPRHLGADLPAGDAPPRTFTIDRVEHALGETGHRALLGPALAAHADPVVKRALAKAIAVPKAEIRRSRTALFLYLLKHHAHEASTHHPRP